MAKTIIIGQILIKYFLCSSWRVGRPKGLKLTKGEKMYYIGLLKSKNPQKICIQLRKDKDCLSPEIIEYFGRRNTTIQEIKTKKRELLKAINTLYGKDYKYLALV